MTTEIVKQHDVTQIDKLVATFSKLDPAATAAKWEELDGAVEKSIVAIDQKFDALGANLIKVRAFLSQMENPGRKNIIEGIVGFPVDLTWTTYARGVAARLKISARCLQDKISGYQLGLPDGQLASSAKRREKKQKQQLEAAATTSVEIEDTPSEWTGNVFKPAAATALVEAARAANSVVEAYDNGIDTAPAIANLRNNTISGRKLNAILLAVDIEAKDDAPADSNDWKAQLVKLLDALDADCMTQHLNKQTTAVISEVEELVYPVPAAAEEDRAAVGPYDSEYPDRIAKMAELDSNDEIAEKIAVKAKRGRKPRTSDPAVTPGEIAMLPPLGEDDAVRNLGHIDPSLNKVRRFESESKDRFPTNVTPFDAGSLDLHEGVA